MKYQLIKCNKNVVMMSDDLSGNKDLRKVGAVMYIITNIQTNKTYVGATGDIKDRISGHKSDCKRGKVHKLYNEIRNNIYKWSDFKVDVWKCVGDLEQAEKDVIKALDSINNGYNLAKGGKGKTGVPASAKQKAAISAYQKDPLRNINQRTAVANIDHTTRNNNPMRTILSKCDGCGEINEYAGLNPAMRSTGIAKSGISKNINNKSSRAGTCKCGGNLTWSVK